MEEVPQIDVMFIRMVTGEDIISQVIKKKQETGAFYVFLNPMKIGYIMQDSGRIGISLFQWIFPRITETQEFPVFPSDILTMAKPSISMSKHYWDTVSRYSSKDESESIPYEDESESEYDDDEEEEIEMTDEDQKSIMNELSKIRRKYH